MAQATILYDEFENYTFKIIATSQASIISKTLTSS